ncbi:transcriptional regulator with XRE-family HTH domain [Sphingomonas sp. SORGH_AS 950]|uniref:helix-turn-helix domain-containing protein n=1 Tax=Sphingomonas sp. SORGH_AS_0950 TaxID=3041792 RepID=UPI0027861333|nr:helix-turn-helix transcriptional regulator [Sphingomonas sp. SORGH_AS_0950]MDQ1159610.1 transcriptional regulator with XRE-family HTH domain [Sphingomonas sp. SORGH_AS_0950]
MQKVIVADSVKIPAAELFGKRLKERRRQLGLTQTQLAEQSGSTAPYVSQVERGQANPTLEVMANFAELVGMEVWEMLRT